MPDFAPSNTPRYIVKYRAAGLEHAVQLRGFRSDTNGAVITKCATAIRNVFNALVANLADDFTWLEATIIPADTEVGLVASLPLAVTGLVPAGDFSPQDKTTHWCFAGKSSLGSKCNFKIFGFQYAPDTGSPSIYKDFVLLASEHAGVNTAYGSLNTAELAGIDNGEVQWRPRVTLKMNDAWLPAVRRGAIG